jgi:hypothetical protein
VELGDEVLLVEVAEGVHIRLARAAIGRRITEPPTAGPKALGTTDSSDGAGIPDTEE